MVYPTSRLITVVGNGELQARPDYAQLQIAVVTEHKNLNEAQRENAVIMNRVIQSLLALTIAREDIQTQFFHVFPRYDYVEGRQQFRAYEVTNALVVNIKELNEIGKVIDTAMKNGANQISQIEFKLENETALYNKALQVALNNANDKMRAIATSLRLTHFPTPIDITEQSVSTPIQWRSVAFTEAAQTPIEQGVIRVEAAVQVKYRY